MRCRSDDILLLLLLPRCAAACCALQLAKWYDGVAGAGGQLNERLLRLRCRVRVSVWCAFFQARNLSTCPTNCSCDQVSACGVPYLPPPPPPPPPSIGTPIVMADCAHRTASAFGVVLWCSALLSHLLCSSTAGKVASRWVIDHQPDGTFKVTTATGATTTTAAATQPERRETTAAAAAAAAAAPLCWDYSATDPEGNRQCTGCLNLGACCLSFETEP
jgi:hypothetical protein